ncbi:MAG: serine protein kinase RIO [Candidatus Woesearchaeota archaeon]|jgi:RIO kinase 1|nr:serine protein kinase RIO [Candidatus Woesearchaeota archaeon]|tara:strand:- start:142 stop:870 length:729 start_codon:yes stop_codon:yes gene_type:complete
MPKARKEKFKEGKEKFKTKHGVFDDFTNRTIFKLITEGHFKGLESPINIGKESNVFSAITGRGSRVIVKIYRLETCDFNLMYDYIKDDPRYMKLKRKRRRIIFAWVQREYRNLMNAREAQVSVPIPITFANNVLVLESIGKNRLIAPMLKDSIPKNKKLFFDKIMDNIRKLYKSGLVHADLSAFNILNFNETPIFIDMSQATLQRHPRAEEFLERDVKNICNFFNKKGLKVSEESAMKKIKK